MDGRICVNKRVDLLLVAYENVADAPLGNVPDLTKVEVNERCSALSVARKGEGGRNEYRSLTFDTHPN